MTVIDSEKIPTDAGDYTVTWYRDETAEHPWHEGYVLRMAETREHIGVRGGDWRPDIPDDVETAIRHATEYAKYGYKPSYSVSPAALVRWLRLTGKKGVTLVDTEFHPVEPSADRSEPVWGIIWDTGGTDDEETARCNVEIDLKTWRAWVEGDVFGWVLTGPDDEIVDYGSVWGYYSFADERDYTLGEATELARDDAAERVEKAGLVGAGFIGVI